jgi:hypothetical protein
MSLGIGLHASVEGCVYSEKYSIRGGGCTVIMPPSGGVALQRRATATTEILTLRVRMTSKKQKAKSKSKGKGKGKGKGNYKGEMRGFFAALQNDKQQ